MKKELRNWLDKSPKPIDLKTLGNIELRVVQSLDPAACGFESIGQETFLAFLTSHKELHKYLGNSIIVDSLKVQDDENTAVSSKQIEEFVLQCGQGKNKVCRDTFFLEKEPIGRTIIFGTHAANMMGNKYQK